MSAAPRIARAFSLTEVIIALGIFAFCIVALLNLLTVGIRATGQTEERLGAANTAQALLEMRRLYPLNPSNAAATPVNLSKWGLPQIEVAELPLAGTNVITEEGEIVSPSSAEAAYNLSYRIALPVFTTAAGIVNTNCVNVHLHLSPLRSVGKLRPYELVSSITL